jgi:AcrR family transcriptional regulator
VTVHAPLVWDLPPAPRDTRLNLSQATIVAAAIRIADADGEQAVTMRRIARDLGSSTPMSLYRYVGSKEGVVDLMIDHVFLEIDLPDRPDPDWRVAMRTLAVRTRAALGRHPWFTSLSHQRPILGPNGLRHNEWSLSALDPTRLPIGTAMSVAGMVFGYAVSFAQNEAEEQRMRARIGVVTDEELRALAAPYIARVVGDPRFPHLARWLTEANEAAPDDQFELGLDCMIEGIARRLVGTA